MALVEDESRSNWLVLPRQVTTKILRKLDVVEVVMSASQVCSLWWNICKDPSMWHTIVMTNLQPSPYSLVKICFYAVRQSCGHLEDINIEGFATDDLLMFIANSTSKLRRVRVAKCPAISERGLLEVVKKSPLLQEFDISYSCIITSDSLEAIGRCCPLLKTLKFNFPCCWSIFTYDGDAFAISKTMPELRHLQIMGSGLTSVGLLAILDGCPLLEFLDLRGCCQIDLSGSLGEKCHQQIKDLRHPRDKDNISDDYSSPEDTLRMMSK